MTGAEQPFAPERTLALLTGQRFLGPVHYKAQTGSTNDDAAQLGAEGVAEGLVVVAEKQTAGRGRHARQWVDEPHRSLLFSLLVRPPEGFRQTPLLVHIAGLAATEAIEAHCGCSASVKWPNDVMVNERKVGGILTEVHPGGVAVIGIGLNIRRFSNGWPEGLSGRAAAVEEFSGGPVVREIVLAAILNRLDELYELLRAGRVREVMRQRRLREVLLGRDVTARAGAQDVVGTVLDIDDEGRLLVKTSAGLCALAGGETALVREKNK